MAILLCLCFYSLYYHFVNLNFICNNSLHIPLSFYIRHIFHFPRFGNKFAENLFADNFKRYDTDVALPSHLQMVF